MQIASICRFGNQDVFRLLGRDPYEKPLSTLELALFQRALYEIVEREYSPNEGYLKTEDLDDSKIITEDDIP